MKISPQTLQVLKNFAGVNSTFIMEQEDSTLRSKTVGGEQVAFANIPETLPKFAIYDLNDFLPIASMFPDADFEFGESSVVISSGKSKFRYAYCSERLIEVKPPRSARVPEPDVTTTIDKATFKTLMTAASALKVENVVIRNESGRIIAATEASKNEGNQNTFSVDLGEAPEGVNFNFVFSSAVFRFIPGDYTLKMSCKFIAEFSCVLGPEHSVTYWIGMDKKSSTFSKAG